MQSKNLQRLFLQAEWKHTFTIKSPIFYYPHTINKETAICFDFKAKHLKVMNLYRKCSVRAVMP